MLTPSLTMLLLGLPVLPPEGRPYPEPELAPLSWLPDHETASRERALCCQHREYLEARLKAEPLRWNDLQEPLRWARWCESCWEDLCFARNEDWQTWARVEALWRLREQLGEGAFQAGRLPWIGEGFRRVD